MALRYMQCVFSVGMKLDHDDLRKLRICKYNFILHRTDLKCNDCLQMKQLGKGLLGIKGKGSNLSLWRGKVSILVTS